MKVRKIIYSLALTFSLVLLSLNTQAQCAMCRVTVENNVSSGETSIGAGLNKGILFLLVMPYAIFAVIAYLWYRHSRKEHEKRIQTAGYLGGEMPTL